MAIITRWHIPPENWKGYSFSRFSAPAIPTFSSSFTALARAADLDILRWAKSVSVNCWPMVNTGFKLAAGSWKIMEILLPRILRNSSRPSVARFLPL